MKSKKFLVLALVLVTLLSVVSANAAEMRSPSASPSLYFDGTTAQCSGECSADTMNDEVIIRLVLYEDGTYVDQWRAEGMGYVFLDATYPATSGKTYRLSLTYTVNGRTVPAISVTGTCP